MFFSCKKSAFFFDDFMLFWLFFLLKWLYDPCTMSMISLSSCFDMMACTFYPRPLNFRNKISQILNPPSKTSFSLKKFRLFICTKRWPLALTRYSHAYCKRFNHVILHCKLYRKLQFSLSLFKKNTSTAINSSIIPERERTVAQKWKENTTELSDKKCKFIYWGNSKSSRI